MKLDAWPEYPLRWAQLTLVENDPGTYDPDFWLDYFARIHAQGACLSAGGYVCYYPTGIPLHHRCAWMGDTDPFGYLAEGCRRMGMVVLARTDPHAVHQDVFEAHPDWVAADADGSPRRHWSMPDAWVTCALGPYNFDYMTDVHREIVGRYDVQGIFSNRWSGHGICYCEHCQRNFREASGHELPLRQLSTDPAWRAYAHWQHDRLLELARHWDVAIGEARPGARYIPNSGGGALSSLDMKTLSDMVPILFADKQGRSGLSAPWSSGKNAKEFRAVFGRKPIGGIFSVGLEERYRWKDSVQSEAELRVWVADQIANGMRPWFTKFAGRIWDDRWLSVVEDIYTWHAKHDAYWRDRVPIANVGLVYSQQTAALYGEAAPDRVEAPILGVYQSLIEARIPFEMVHDRHMDAEHLAGFAVLILPNVAALSDVQCDQLRAFVARGGGLVATLETSLYDEEGRRRATFGLADLFGVDPLSAADVEGPLRNGYLRLEHSVPTAGTLLSGLENAQRTVYGGYQLVVKVRDESSHEAPAITLVPPYPDLPMEEVYPRQPHTRIPAVFCRQHGLGRVLYVPWDLDRIFWEVLNPDHGKLLANAVRWAMDAVAPVTVDGPGVLDVVAWRGPDAITVHLVNLTNPMMMRGAFRELLPVGPHTVSIRLPEGLRVSRVHLLRAGGDIDHLIDDGVLVVTVPQIVDHEVVAIDVNEPWYHGSPLMLEVLRAGSTITHVRDLARVFSHKPPLVSISDNGKIQHNGTQPGYLYEVADPVAADDVYPHPRTTMRPGDEWLTNRDLKLRLVEATELRPDELLSEDDICAFRKRLAAK
ncbi:MAG: beta-galactosidase trimerization domain-containing protein [Anaerolineae bacterium]|nr:beta-galactosidase trimerization domain-containing protein [Anaerolineae bacterium]